MSIPEICEDIKILKRSVNEIIEAIQILRLHNEQSMERHSAVIIAGVKTIQEESKSTESTPSISSNNIFQRRGEMSPKTKEKHNNTPNGKFGIEDLNK